MAILAKLKDKYFQSTSLFNPDCTVQAGKIPENYRKISPALKETENNKSKKRQPSNTDVDQDFDFKIFWDLA